MVVRVPSSGRHRQHAESAEEGRDPRRRWSEDTMSRGFRRGCHRVRPLM